MSDINVLVEGSDEVAVPVQESLVLWSLWPIKGDNKKTRKKLENMFINATATAGGRKGVVFMTPKCLNMVRIWRNHLPRKSFWHVLVRLLKR